MSRARDLSKIGNKSTLAVDTDNIEVGIGSTVPSSTLDVRGEIKVGTAVQLGSAGVVTATSFSGSGANLTGLATTETVRTDTLTVAGVSTLTGAVNVDATTDSTSVTTGALIVDGGVGIAKNVYIGAGLSVAGTLTYEDVTNVDAVGLITAKSGVNVTGGQIQVGAAFSVGPAGVVTATSYYGDGSNLSNITSTTINNNADNRLISGSGTANTLNGESTLTYDGSTLALTGNQTISSKLTVGSGITFGSAGVATFSGTADVHLVDNVQLKLGTGSDGTIKHNGTNLEINESTGDLRLVSDADDVIIQAEDDVVIRDNDGSTSMAKFINGGSVELYEAGTKRLETTTTGVSVAGTTISNGGDFITYDNGHLKLGNNSDLDLFHSGTDSFIRNSINNLNINGGNSAGNVYINLNENVAGVTSERAASFIRNGAVELYYDANKKFETTNDGVVISGICTDSLGNVRGIPQNAKGTNYTLVKSDAGKHIYCTSTPTITVDNSVFSTGDVITIVNASTSDMTITQGSGQNLYIPGESSAGSLTLGTYGIMTMLCTASDGSVMWCSGAELTKS